MAAPDPVYDQLAAVSCGMVGGAARLDLEYEEDSQAETDANFVMTTAGGIVEIQATAEDRPLPQEDFNRLFELAHKGIAELGEIQKSVL